MGVSDQFKSRVFLTAITVMVDVSHLKLCNLMHYITTLTKILHYLIIFPFFTLILIKLKYILSLPLPLPLSPSHLSLCLSISPCFSHFYLSISLSLSLLEGCIDKSWRWQLGVGNAWRSHSGSRQRDQGWTACWVLFKMS